jgi:hypothetical protein
VAQFGSERLNGVQEVDSSSLSAPINERLMSEEKRRAVRVKSAIFIQYCLDLNSSSKKWDITSVKNLSETGVCIVTGKPFEANSDIEIRFKLPSRPFEPIDVLGRVVESKESGFANAYITRVEFKDLTDEIKNVFHDYIEWVLKNEKQ